MQAIESSGFLEEQCAKLMPFLAGTPSVEVYEVSLSDRSIGKIMATTFWATEADLLAGESSGYYQAQIAKVAHVLTSQVVREAYGVVLQQGMSLS